MSRDHRKIRAFVLADELVMLTYRLTRSFPRDEWFGLRAQMRRCALSVASNIVEGAARRTQSEYLNFLNMAFGSVRELGYQISVASRLDYLTPSAADELERLQAETARVLAALLRSFNRR